MLNTDKKERKHIHSAFFAVVCVFEMNESIRNIQILHPLI